MSKFNIRVEYDATPVRHLAVQCPNCKRWFHGREISSDEILYKHDVCFALFTCPICDEEFGFHFDGSFDDYEISEVGYPEVYKDALEKKVTWE